MTSRREIVHAHTKMFVNGYLSFIKVTGQIGEHQHLCSFAYLKIPIKVQLMGFKDHIDRFQFQLPTKLVSSNSLFPIPFLERGPFLILVDFSYFKYAFLTCAYTFLFL